MKEKYCHSCKKIKEIIYFNKNENKKDGLSSECKDCIRVYRSKNRFKIAEYNKKWRVKNKDTVRSYQKNRQPRKKYLSKYNKKYRKIKKIDKLFYIKNAYQKLTYRSKKRNINKNFDYEWFKEFALNSKVFNRLFIDWIDKGFPLKLNPTVDRINNNKGYLKLNIQFLTLSENARKGNK